LGRDYLYRAFEAMGLFYLPTQTNFILIRVGGSRREIYERLLRKGVIIRHLENGYLRVTIGLPDENRRFVEALQQVLGSGIGLR
jgi:histidinol-phosphate aminotransferase